MRLTPAERTMLVSEAGALALRDDFGMAISGAAWHSTNEQVVALSDDDPPVLTAVATGAATITATKGGLTASATVTVVAGESLSAGTVQWRFPPTPNVALFRESPIFTHRIDATGPDTFVVERSGAYDHSTYGVVAITSSGEEFWRMAAPGTPLFGDTFGGIIGGVESDMVPCRVFGDQFEACYTSLVRFAGPATTATWRYESTGLISRPAQGPSGALYFIERASYGVGYIRKSIVTLDGATGHVIGRVPLANAVFDRPLIPDANGMRCSENYGRIELEPQTLGPIVGGDGDAYLVEWRRPSETTVIDCRPIDPQFHFTRFEGTSEYRLLRLSSEGQVTATALAGAGCPGGCHIETLKQLLPDGLGGTLVMAEYQVGDPAYTLLNATRIDEDGQRTDMAWPRGTRIELVGQAGKVYLNTKSSPTSSSAKWVVDLPSGATQWNLPTDWQWRAAAPDGGAAVERSGQLGYFDGAGQLLETHPSTVFHPVHENDSVIGTNGEDAGVTAVVKPFANATRFGANYGPFSTGSSADVVTAFGDQYGASAQRNPGQGIFLKSHWADPRLPDIHHFSLRIVPFDQKGWASKFPPNPGRDVYGNTFFTIGAGPGPDGEDTNSSCSGTLTKGTNRDRDVGQPPKTFTPLSLALQAAGGLIVLRPQELVINSIRSAYRHYHDDLPYACRPDWNPGFYNSNSFIAGLMEAVKIYKPFVPALAPGWETPVPKTKFQ